MSKHKDLIRLDDCPAGKAPYYPGKKSKDNRNGSELSRSEFVDKVISNWVEHFNGSELYERAPWHNKTSYLMIYLKPLNITRTEAGQRLIAIEKKLVVEAQDKKLSDSQNMIENDMEIDTGPVDLQISPEQSFEDSPEQSPERSSDRSRWHKYKEVETFLKLSDEELFDGNIEIPDHVVAATRFKKREMQFLLAKTDVELFEQDKYIPSYTKKSSEFQERQNRYINKYMEDTFALSSSQDLLENLSQTPKTVQNSEIFKNFLSHLSNEERSQRLVMKNIRDSLNELEKTPEGRKESKKIIAAVSHPVFGDPGLELNWKVKHDTKQMKENLLTGITKTLELPEKKKRKHFPDRVEAIADEHWKENTIVEPAKHRSVRDEGETVPTRYQDKTDQECYESFKEDCSEKIKIEMTKVAQEMKLSLVNRPNTLDKQRRMEYAESLPNKFPSFDWYIDRRPPETKPLCDHTTGLCHVCESSKLNFSNIVQVAKRLCNCGTMSCPEWSCACPIPDEEDDETACTCPPCECESCSSCQVS